MISFTGGANPPTLAGIISGPVWRCGILMLALVTLATGACTRRIRFQEAKNVNADGARATVTDPGLTRLLIHRPEGAAPWHTLTLANAGEQPIEQIRLWGMGGLDVLQAGPGAAEFEPFALLPGETLALSDTTLDAPERPAQVAGLMSWQVTRANWRLSIARESHIFWMTSDARSGLQGDGARGGAIELPFAAPLPHTRAVVHWQASGEGAEFWVSYNRRAWTRLPMGRHVRQELDFSTSVAGHHDFWLRVVLPPTDGDATTLLHELRVEREVAGPGRLREWRTGINELSVSRGGGNSPLAVALVGLGGR